MELVDHVRLGRAEAAREGNVLRRRQRLRAQDQNLRLEERAFQLREFRIGKRAGAIDTARRQPETGGKRLETCIHFTYAGISLRGSHSIRSGKNITMSRTSSIGMNRIAVSRTASLILIPPIEQAIMRHKP